MNILFFSPTNIYSNIAEIELELMQRHVDLGDTIHQIICEGEINFCEINKTHNKFQCLYCKHKHIKSNSLISKNVTVHKLKDYIPKQNQIFMSQNYDFENIDSLKSYWFDEYLDIGYCAASYLISEYRDPFYDVSTQQEHLKLIFETILKIYQATINFLTTNQIDIVYVWNGRMPTMRPVIRAAKAVNVNFRTFNNSTSFLRYDIVENHLHHDLNATANRILQHWNNSKEAIEIKEEIARKYYQKRTLKQESKTEIVNIFVNKQDADRLPDDWDATKINIAIFNSSEDEMSSISDEWKNLLYKDQYDGLCQLIKSVEKDSNFKNYHFYLRIHPNLSGVKNKDVDRILALQSSKLTIIPADSPVSTYLLIKETNKTVTFGSSAGIEAVFMEKPSILIGKCFYRNLPGGTYQPESHAEFIEMLLLPLSALDKTAALMYGYFWSTFGTPLKYVEMKNGNWLFKGRKLRSHIIYETLKSLKGKIKK